MGLVKKKSPHFLDRVDTRYPGGHCEESKVLVDKTTIYTNQKFFNAS